MPRNRAASLPKTAAVALWLARHGIHVHPLTPGAKLPPRGCDRCSAGSDAYREHAAEECPCLPAGRWCHGVRAATTNPEHITQWWERMPGAGIGVAGGPSNLVIVDVDNHGADHPEAGAYLPGVEHSEVVPGSMRDGYDTLALLAEARCAQLPGLSGDTMAVQTPSGGLHVWYRVPDGMAWKPSAGRLGWQLDLRAGWAYGIAPGTATRKGAYTALGDCRAVADLPAWLAADLKRTGHYVAKPAVRKSARQLLAAIARPKGTAYVDAAVRAEVARTAEAGEGARNSTLYASARALARFVPAGQLAQGEIEQALTAAAQVAGLSEGEARAAIRSALRTPIRQGGAA